MPSKSYFDAMISHLDRSEKALLRKQLGPQELLFFEGLTNKKSIDATALRKKFAELNDGEYATLRSRAMDRMAKIVHAYRAANRSDVQVQQLVGMADVYMNTGMPEDAQRILKKAITAAIRFEEFKEIDWMTALRSRLPEFLKGNKRAAKKWTAVDGLLAELAVNQQKVVAAKELLHSALEIKQDGLEGRKERTAALLVRIPEIDPAMFSKANLFLARTAWICKGLVSDYEGCLLGLEWVIAHKHDCPWLWNEMEAFEAIEAAHITKAAFYSQDLNFHDAINLLDTFRAEAHLVKRFSLPEIDNLTQLLRLRLLLHTGTKLEIKAGLKLLLKQIGKPKVVSPYLHDLYVYVLRHHLEQREFGATKPWLVLLADSKPQFKMARVVINGFVIELAIYYAAGELNEVDNALRRLVYFHDSRNTDSEFINVIANGFRALTRSHPKPRQALMDFIAKLEEGELESSEQFRGYSQVFDLRQFLRDQLKNL